MLGSCTSSVHVLKLQKSFQLGHKFQNTLGLRFHVLFASKMALNKSKFNTPLAYKQTCCQCTGWCSKWNMERRYIHRAVLKSLMMHSVCFIQKTAIVFQ